MKVGVFDSGVGGLTVYTAIAKKYPNLEIVYFGDTANVPYGDKKPEFIIENSLQCAQYLVNKEKIDILIIACNTVSCYALDILKTCFNIPVFGVVESGAIRACELSKNQHIGITGTTATVNSGIYEKYLLAINPDIKIEKKACPKLVPMIEKGIVSGDSAKKLVKFYFDPIVENGADTIILGCTHYPLLKNILSETYKQINFAESTSNLLKQIKPFTLLEDKKAKAERIFLATSNSVFFEQIVKKLYPVNSKFKIITNIP